MGKALRFFPASGKVAMFDEASGGGDIFDITSQCNRPANSPASWLSSIYFHSDLDIAEVVSDTTVSITHASVGGSTSSGLSAGGLGSDSSAAENAAVVRYNAGSTDDLAVSHGLGYVPDALVVVGSNVLDPGMPVQLTGSGIGRYASLYLTTTEARIKTWASVSGSALSSVTLSYRVIILRQPRTASGNKLFDFDPSTGITKMAKDRFSTDRNYLQVVVGGSPYGIAYGKTIDLANGAPKFFFPDGTTFEPVPSTLKSRIVIGYGNGAATYTGSYGSAQNYNGAASGPTQILVQAP